MRKKFVEFNEENAGYLDEIMGLLANAAVNQVSIYTGTIWHTIKKLPDPYGQNKASLSWSIRRQWLDEDPTKKEVEFFKAPMGFPRVYFFYDSFFKEFLAFVDLLGLTIESHHISLSPNFDPELHRKLKMWRHMEASQC